MSTQGRGRGNNYPSNFPLCFVMNHDNEEMLTEFDDAKKNSMPFYHIMPATELEKNARNIPTLLPGGGNKLLDALLKDKSGSSNLKEEEKGRDYNSSDDNPRPAADIDNASDDFHLWVCSTFLSALLLFSANNNGIADKPHFAIIISIFTEENPDWQRFHQPEWTRGKKLDGGVEFMGCCCQGPPARPNIQLQVTMTFGIIEWSTLKAVLVRDWWFEIPIVHWVRGPTEP